MCHAFLTDANTDSPCSTSCACSPHTRFDSRTLSSLVLAGDARLAAKLRREELLPPGSRIRTRLNMEYAGREALVACLKHLQQSAGNTSLMTEELMHTLAEHALGNYRVLTTMAAELLATAARLERPQLDAQLYLEVFGAPAVAARKRA